MVHKRYLKKGNKIFGPYYYRSYREDGKVKKEYIGKEDEYQEWLKKNEKKDEKKKGKKSEGVKIGKRVKKFFEAKK